MLFFVYRHLQVNVRAWSSPSFLPKFAKPNQLNRKERYMTKGKLSKGEKAILDEGYNIALPVNFIVLFTQSERDVLNIIRHRINVKHPHVSMSLFSLMTGLSENTVRRARDSLLDMGIIEASDDGISIGKAYKVKYDILIPMIAKLNNEKNPVKRLELADKLRGKGREINQKQIEKFRGSEFNY